MKKKIEFNLSERLMYLDEEKGFTKEDVKKFINLIESDLHWKFDEGDLGVIMNVIKKRAGDLK